MVTRKRQRRQLVRSEDSELEHLRAGLDLFAIDHAAAKRNADDRRRRRLGDVIQAEQLRQIYLRADLLHAFANRGILRIFVVVDKPTWQAPQAVARLDGAPAEDDAPGVLDDDRGRDLRVSPQHEVVVGTGLVLAAFDHPRDQRRAAFDAEVAGQRSRA